MRARDAARGDVLAAAGGPAETTVVDCALDVPGARHGERVQVHHGTRDVAGRLTDLGDGLWQLRLERPVLAADGDRVVLRRPAPPDTLGGGVVLDAGARRHGRRPDVLARLRARRDGRPEPGPPAPPPGPPRAVPARPSPADPALLARAEARLRDAGLGLLSEAQLGDDAAALAPLRAAGRAVRVSGTLYAHAEVAAAVRARIVALLEREGSVSLAEVRDALATSRKPAQAFLEHLDAERVTRRLPDDRRVLRARRSAPVPALAHAAPETLGASHGLGLVDALAHAAARRRQLRGLGRGDGQRDPALGDAGDLGRVNEALAVLGVDDDAVEDVLAPGLLRAAHRSHLDAVRRAHGRPARHDLVGDGLAVVVVCHGPPGCHSW